MNTFYIKGRKHLEEVEGELYQYDYRFFLLKLEENMCFLFSRESGTYIAYSNEEKHLYDEYDKIKEVYEMLIQTRKYQKDVKKFNKYLEMGRIIPIEQ